MEIIETLLNGLSVGSTYAMIALGYTMVYGIAKLLNFAHGDIIMIGGYTIYLTLLMNGHPIFGLVAAVLICVLLGVTIEKIAYKPLRSASPLEVLITAIGVSYLLQSTAQMIFGSAPKMVIVADLGNFTIGDLKVPVYTLITLICSFAIMIALNFFVKYTKIGRAMITVSEDRGAAQLMGINVNGIIAIAAVTVLFAVLSLVGALSSSTIYLLEKIAIAIMLAVSLSVVVGFLGELSLGHAGFMCVGAYLGGKTACLLEPVFGNSLVTLLISIIVGGLAAAMCGVLIGLPALRLKGDYLVIVTLAFGEIVRSLFMNSSSESFGGSLGLAPPLRQIGAVYHRAGAVLPDGHSEPDPLQARTCHHLHP